MGIGWTFLTTSTWTTLPVLASATCGLCLAKNGVLSVSASSFEKDFGDFSCRGVVKNYVAHCFGGSLYWIYEILGRALFLV